MGAGEHMRSVMCANGCELQPESSEAAVTFCEKVAGSMSNQGLDDWDFHCSK